MWQFANNAKSVTETNTEQGQKSPITPITNASSTRQVVAYCVATLPWGNGLRYFVQIQTCFPNGLSLFHERPNISHDSQSPTFLLDTEACTP